MSTTTTSPEPVDPGALNQVLDVFTEKALNGFTVAGMTFDSADQLVASARQAAKDVDGQVDWIVTRSIAQAAMLGGVTSFGGFITLPVTLSANIVGTSVIQMRLCYAIAKLNGYDLDSPQTRACVQMIAFGMKASAVLKEVAMKAITPQVVKLIAARMAQDAGRRVATKVIQKAATRAATRWIPIIGAVIGAAVDGTGTWLVANQARNLFKPAEMA